MSLSKQQMIGLGCGGVFVLAAGALGYLLFDAASARADAEQELADQTAAFTRYNEAPVFPSKKSIADVKSNETSYAAWYDAALALAARGDRPPPADEEPSVFKQRLQTEVRRLLALPGGVDGHLAAPTFLFGFEQYLGESGVLPQSADVPRLATQLASVAHIVDILAASGVLEVKAVQRLEAKAARDEDEAPAQRRGRRPAARKPVADEAAAPAITHLDYAFEFTTRPAALVQVLNRLTADTRFITVQSFAFRETADMIVDRLAARDAAEATKSAPAAGRRRRGATAPAAPAEPKKTDRLVVDPELDAPIQVNLTLSVYDFGTGGAAPAAKDEKDAKESV